MSVVTLAVVLYTNGVKKKQKKNLGLGRTPSCGILVLYTNGVNKKQRRI
jgi:hypothetical protein